MKTVLLKNVPEDDWVTFRTEAISHGMKLAEFLSYIIKEHTTKKHAGAKWDKILRWSSGQSKEEINKMEKTLDKLRHEFKLER